MTTIGAGNSFCYIQLKNVFKNLLIAVLGSHHIFGFTWPRRPLETYSPTWGRQSLFGSSREVWREALCDDLRKG